MMWSEDTQQPRPRRMGFFRRAPFHAVALSALLLGQPPVPGCGSKSASRTATTPSSPAPAVDPAKQLGVVLGRPTDHSIAASIRADAGVDLYVEYGTTPGSYAVQSAHLAGSAGGPVVTTLMGLTADTQYYYRVRHRASGETAYGADTEHTFHTRRPPGSSFTFVVEADPHFDTNSSMAVYSQALLNQLGDRPDFMFDLGDTSMVEKCAVSGTVQCAPPAPTSAASVLGRYSLVRSYFDTVCHSMPLLMVLGNHDGELGWDATTSAWALATRKAFFANPEPDGFYTGSSDALPGAGLRQNYYAFEWGDALLVVLDPYSYTSPKPGQDGWGWTLGATQYQWLASTLAASHARFKFVFSHHLVGGNGNDARGGAAFAQLFEWGGRNADGTWAFDTRRPGWRAPIHQLLVENKVSAWLHGHDHFYAREELDGIVYQEVPQPSQTRYDNADPGAGYGYLGSVGDNQFPSSGHLRFTVSPSEVRVEYVRAVAPADETATRGNGTIVTSYVIR